MFQMLQAVRQFSGIPTEDPHLHLRLFMEVSDSFKLAGVPKVALQLKLFPYSLRDRARDWLNSLPPNLISTWIARNNYQWPSNRAVSRRRVTRTHEVDALTSLSSQVFMSIDRIIDFIPVDPEIEQTFRQGRRQTS
ncbi:uncharacterized protein LOC105793202 [Gossypium raimondii]|uniref:uncharacterized protein LOC105793202 n=1 Tax=Gossypium raimondii TaxID=29730 RepID=UPI00063ADC40|nr:uncharacterized protein LOC105793202 [Gossypium raimondii]